MTSQILFLCVVASVGAFLLDGNPASTDILSTLGIEGCGKADIVFLVQHSPLVDMYDVDHQADMIRNLVNGWTIDDQHVRLAVTLYEGRISQFIKLTDNQNVKTSLIDKLEWMYYNLGPAGYTNLSDVIDFTRLNTFQNARPGANKIAVSLVGHLNDGAKIKYLEAAKHLQDTGVTLYVLAVGPSDEDRTVLTTRTNHYFEYPDWASLEAAVPVRNFVPNCQLWHPTTTSAPTTLAPTTPRPTTPVPATSAPSTSAPTTAVPTTPVPTTPVPTTPGPTTGAPISGVCANNPCLNGGTCYPTDVSFYCECVPGYSPPFCL